MIDRRGALKTLAALGAASATAGCAVGGGTRSAASELMPGTARRVVIAGGGWGGITAARYLRRLAPDLEVVVLERNPVFFSCPMSNKWLVDVIETNFLMHDQLHPAARAGYRFVNTEITAIDRERKRVHVTGGYVRYDWLVLSPGIGFMTNEVGGLQGALDAGRVVHAWQAGAQTVALRNQLTAMRDGGVVAISIPKVPYRCPPGPYERACMIASYLKTAKPKSKLLVLDANPEVQSKKALFEKAFADHYKGILEYRPNAELKEVSGGVAKLEFEDVKADVLNVVPPQRAADLARTAGVVNINNRWAGVDWLTMESTAVKGVHVLGDATFPAPTMPKSGHMANQHAKLAAAAIIQLLKGEPVNATPVVMNTCYSFVTQRDVIHVASVHQYDAADKTVKPVPGSGGVSVAANQIEGRYALSWAENIWADMLAL